MSKLYVVLSDGTFPLTKIITLLKEKGHMTVAVDPKDTPQSGAVVITNPTSELAKEAVVAVGKAVTASLPDLADAKPVEPEVKVDIKEKELPTEESAKERVAAAVGPPGASLNPETDAEADKRHRAHMTTRAFTF